MNARVVAAVVAGSVFALAGCSSTSSADGKVPAAFVTRAEQVCSANLAQFPNVGTFPDSNFNDEDPSPAQLPPLGAYFAENQRGNSAFEAALQGLGGPAEGASSWNNLKTLLAEFLANGKTQVKDADAANVSAFVAAVNQNQTITNEIISAAKHSGFPTTGPCEQLLFG